MNTGEGNSGVASLANILNSRMKEVGASPLVLDFGTIQGNWSLLTNTFPVPIPRGHYMICGATGTGSQTVQTTEWTDKDGVRHRHSVTVPGTSSRIQPGARVLVAWVQNDAVVVDVIRSS